MNINKLIKVCFFYSTFFSILSVPDEGYTGVYSRNALCTLNMISTFYYGSIYFHYSDPVLAQDWCETTTCPGPSSATQENCCIHHMNIHSCPLEDESITNGLCGPWIPAKGQIITHSDVLVGNALVGNWTNVVPGLYVTGQTSIISHYKVAGISIALVYDVVVKPKAGK